MERVELLPSDRKMVRRWQRHTEFMLQRLPRDEVKRLVDYIQEGRNYTVNDKGDIIEADESFIERDKKELTERMVEKVEEVKKPEQVIEDKISELRQEVELPGSPAEKTHKLSVLQEVMEEIQ